MLRVALPDARAGAVETVGEIAPGDPLLTGCEWPLAEPLSVKGRFSGAGEGMFYWKVHLRTVARAQCRRCLVPVDVPVKADLGLIFSSGDVAPEGEGCYQIPPRTQVLDLTGAVREEMLLAMPHFVECRPDCQGLCPRCGANLNEGPCGCAKQGDPRWDALRALTPPDPSTD